MDNSKINTRYAKAFFSLANEKGISSRLKEDVRLISSVCDSNSDFVALIDSPVIPNSIKIKTFRKLFEDRIDPNSLNFIILIVKNNREKNIPGIFRNLEDLFRKSDAIKTAILTTANSLDLPVTDRIRTSIENELKVKIDLQVKVKPELIGGFILRVDDNQYDASVSTQLRKIREELLQTNLNS